MQQKTTVLDLDRNHSYLRSRARKEAYWGLCIAITAIVGGTALVSFFSDETLTIDGMIYAQKHNLGLMIVDLFAFVFPIWAQFTYFQSATRANVLVEQQTRELVERATTLENERNFVATHDPVTELPNRSLFYDRLQFSLKNFINSKKPGGLLFIQIENLKDLQNRLGLNHSDMVLRQIATRLIKTMGYLDSVARIESDVFAILPNASMTNDELLLLGRALQRALEPSFDASSLRVTINAHIGIVQIPDHGDSVGILLQHAGLALYMAGKNFHRIAIYSATFDESSPRSLTLMGDLKLSIEEGQLELYYQPKLDLKTGKVYGAEALVRWNHPKHGMLPPDEFIGLVEKSQMIKPFTQWVIERAFQDYAILRDLGANMKISINLSARDLHDPELPDRIIGAMAKTTAEPKWFIFEITETSIMHDPERVREVLYRIHECGFEISIDDFGTGYSSLGYLRKLPIKELKIDKSFIIDMNSNENDLVIVRATIDLAHNLGLKVAAEGVEHPESYELLKSFGCDYAQGYFISRPIPRTEFLRWLKQNEQKNAS